MKESNKGVEDRFKRKFSEYYRNFDRYTLDIPKDYALDPDDVLAFLLQEIASAKAAERNRICEQLLKKAREVDYADRTEYDVAYDFISSISQEDDKLCN